LHIHGVGTVTEQVHRMGAETAPTKTIVMTGATRGLGRVAALKLLRAAPGLHLIVVARSGGEALAGELREQSGNRNVSSAMADLASLDSIRVAAAGLVSDFASEALPPLVGFVGNAGLQLTTATQATVDGIELTFAVNVLANHALIDALRDQFSAPARIVLTTSDTHFGDFTHNLGMVPGPRWDEPIQLATPGAAKRAERTAAGRTAYSTSKLAVIYLVHALARRLPPGIDAFAFNPGLVPGTGLVREANPLSRFAFRRLLPALTLTPFARSLEGAGADLAAAALAPPRGETGSYINGTRVERSSPESYDVEREETLWHELERLTERAAR
jgi:NAD(P)-dependent dehydrogenase (short-subunit alcohol dehydrogenase family)